MGERGGSRSNSSVSISETIAGESTAPLMSDVLLFLCAVTPMVVVLGFFAKGPLDPLVLITALNFPLFVVRPMLVITGATQPKYLFLYSESIPDLAREAMVLYIVAYVAFTAAYLARGRRRLRQGTTAFAGRRLDGERLTWVVALAVAASTTTVVYFIAEVGSVTEFVYRARAGLFSGRSVFVKLPLTASFLAVLLLLHNLKRRQGVTLAVLLLLGSLVGIMTLGDRSGVVAPLLALAVGFNYSVRKLPARKVAVWAALGGLTLAVITTVRAAIYHGQGGNLVDVLALAFTGNVVEGLFNATSFSTTMNLDMVDYFMVVLQDFSYDTFHYGSDFVRGLIGIVPRAVWAGKPEYIGVGNWFGAVYFGRPLIGAPITATGEWWLNFGIAGVVFGAALSGWLARSVWAFAERNKFAEWSVLPFLVLFLNMTAWGYIAASIFVAFVFWVIPFWGVYHWVLVPSEPKRRRPVAVLALEATPLVS